jgi:hypothetical protein
MQIKAVSALGGKTKPNSMFFVEIFVGSYAVIAEAHGFCMRTFGLRKCRLCCVVIAVFLSDAS